MRRKSRILLCFAVLWVLGIAYYFYSGTTLSRKVGFYVRFMLHAAGSLLLEVARRDCVEIFSLRMNEEKQSPRREKPKRLNSQSLMSGLTKIVLSLRAVISLRDYQITASVWTEFKARCVTLVSKRRIYSEVVFRSFDAPIFFRSERDVNCLDKHEQFRWWMLHCSANATIIHEVSV